MCSLFACVEVPPSVDAGASGGGTGRTGGGSGSSGGGTATGGGTGTGGGVNDDSTAPELLDTTPSSGSMNVAVAQPLRLIFSEPMEPSSLQLTTTPAVTLNTPTPNANGTLFTIEHAAFSFDTSYTVTINGRDLAGNLLASQTLSFRTEGAPDTTPPTVLSTLPGDMTTGVAVTSPFVVTFSEAMDRDSVQISATPTTTFEPMNFASNDSEVSLTPVTDLTPNTSYTFTIRGNDVSGNALTQQSVTFTTEAPRDTTAPSLVSSSPSNAQMNVTTSSRVSLTFSEAIAEESLVVTISPVVDLGEPTFSNQGRTATFSAPAADFVAARTYKVTVEADDLAANPLPSTSFNFTTAVPPDTTRPTVGSTSPSTGATNVPVNSNLEFNFSEAMDQLATEAAFSTTPALTSRTITWNAARTLMSVNPGTDLMPGSQVTMVIGTGAKDLAGNGLLTAKTVSFRTAAAPDTTKPTIVSTSPVTSAIGVARDAKISVTFSEPMRQAAAQAAFQIIEPTGFNGGVFSWNSTSTTLTYTPPDDFAYGESVRFSISAGAEDLAGNTLASSLTRSFRTKQIATKSFYAFGTTDVSTKDPRAGRIQTNGSCNSASLSTRVNAVAGDEEQGFMTFDLSPLAALSGVHIRLAMLSVEQLACSSILPNVPGIDSSIIASSVNYGPSLTLDDCNSPTLSTYNFTLSSDPQAGRRTRLVTAAVQNDFANRAMRDNRSQWRLHTTRTGLRNQCVFASQNNSTNRPFLRISYEFD